jgi:hypothetical protein
VNGVSKDSDSEFALFGSQTSYEATVGEDASHGLAVPPEPEVAFDGVAFQFGEPFQCPYCFTELSVRNRSEWKYVTHYLGSRYSQADYLGNIYFQT